MRENEANGNTTPVHSNQKHKEIAELTKASLPPPQPLPSKGSDEGGEEMATLTLPDGRTHKLRVLKPTCGNQTFIDIRDLLSATNAATFDPGYSSSASCCSAITYIDGDKGTCLYRGYPVHELVEKSHFEEVAYLLMYGEVPAENVRLMFEKQLKSEMLVHERLKNFFTEFLTGAHPMAMLATVVAALSSFFVDPMDLNDAEERELAIIRLIAKMPTIVGMCYKTAVGEPFNYPRMHMSFAENLLYMMFARPLEEYTVDPLHAKIVDAFLILHADHEQNASTSTVRTAGSSRANPYACVAAGITALWGRAHGGANEAVIKMLKEIGDVSGVPDFVQKVKDKKVRLMGFGHRIYKNYDPRAIAMRGLCRQLFEAGTQRDPLFDLAMALEEVALSDDYFVKRKLYPNVDFYSGIVLRAIGIPQEMFTVMFALGRTVGWLSHWKEMIQEQQMKICRPRQLYVGPTERAYISPAEISAERLRAPSPPPRSEPQSEESVSIARQPSDIPRHRTKVVIEAPSIESEYINEFMPTETEMSKHFDFHKVQAMVVKRLSSDRRSTRGEPLGSPFPFIRQSESEWDDHHFNPDDPAPQTPTSRERLDSLSMLSSGSAGG
ncbi:unnamed protein product [Vitrella brassicaformis CCMP3155]|uniref:Citrate synthase n=1 Tax=Vitrella brassicaformis (strain CCMP3155) TaxID=1169540 RepID=A0A0G4ELV5_VITBC|nr:unnamed protein product [Vitrella brassicaformis CCMP3155]|mmetsp:Transcript_6952/g.20141  ORF Transcript_6952/g.20141 Transcript_6952/m.20141 type:complete len:609 (-) Transcript_6952:540-2366(-)|eukprot:CEL98102.1 unnamed protein product [Vitrella brassicaformis CCMP3155]